jgi:hypothetical protein
MPGLPGQQPPQCWQRHRSRQNAGKSRGRLPDNNSGKVFLALAYYSDGREDESVRLLLELLLQTTTDENILAYADPLDYYKDHLDEVWDD